MLASCHAQFKSENGVAEKNPVVYHSWCWDIYLHRNPINDPNGGKYTSTMDHLGLLFQMNFGESNICIFSPPGPKKNASCWDGKCHTHWQVHCIHTKLHNLQSISKPLGNGSSSTKTHLQICCYKDQDIRTRW